MDYEALIKSIRASRATLPADLADMTNLSLLVSRVSKNPSLNPQIANLLEQLGQQPELKIFDNYRQCFGGMMLPVTYPSLAAWILRRGRSAEASSVLLELEKYLHSTHLPSTYNMALDGFELTERCQLSSDLKLIPWSEVPESDHKRYVQDIANNRMKIPSGIMSVGVSVPLAHISNEEATSFVPDRVEMPHTELEDARLCIGLFGPIAPSSIAEWLQPPSWAPVFGACYSSFFHDAGISPPRTWAADAVQRLPQLYQRFNALPEKRKSRMRLAMTRLNTAMRELSPVDVAIDIGIALETLYLADMDDDRGELGFRLRLRASRYLYSDFSDRWECSRLVRDLYAKRSTAVHTGGLSLLGSSEVRDLFERGFTLIASTVVRMILEGDPDWNRVTYS